MLSATAVSSGCTTAALDHVPLEQQREQREAELAAHADDDAGAQRLARVRHELPHDQRRRSRPSASSRPASSSSTSGSCVTSRRRSSSIPTETKNSPSRMSWNGLMTASVWCLNSVSASSMPARNAAERHGQAERVRRPRAAQRHEQDREGEGLGAAMPRDLVEQRPQHPAAQHQHDQQRDDRAPDHAEQPRRSERLAGFADRGREREQRRERQVLEQQDAHARAASACG